MREVRELRAARRNESPARVARARASDQEARGLTRATLVGRVPCNSLWSGAGAMLDPHRSIDVERSEDRQRRSDQASIRISVRKPHAAFGDSVGKRHVQMLATVIAGLDFQPVMPARLFAMVLGASVRMGRVLRARLGADAQHPPRNHADPRLREQEQRKHEAGDGANGHGCVGSDLIDRRFASIACNTSGSPRGSRRISRPGDFL